VYSRASAGSLSPDLSYCDFYLFPKLKSTVKGYHFQTLDSIQNAATDAIKTCCEAWKIRWAKYIASDGCYFEGDSADLDE
jgi:hypothetical protein